MKENFLLDLIKIRLKNKIKLDNKNNNKINFFKNLNIKKNSIEISGKNNELEIRSNVELKNVVIKLNGKNNKIVIKENSKLKDTDIIVNEKNNKIIISENIKIYKSYFFINGENSKIFVGKDTTIEGAKLNSQENNNEIFIGENCMFSYNVEVRNTDSHPIFDFQNKLINNGQKVIIKDRVWLSEGVTVLKGVVIENDCIVGAKSLVTKSIDKSNSLSAGIPAKIIKEKVKWRRFFDNKEIK
ncbi:Putative acetyltransferase SACOL2570 [Sebaldella termitidis]|jgi:acetyltransferase-like isoleucine patch superfamily enzyme|uniref:Acetyltransferase n=1 Tax=Sebaldella termitidis (strain ATCC 33386 / NCTC 11300) TaxID=526218 RepID=D1APB4_SEBTE|nr:acyltransferase [Sebaldella termitidis]ACZ09948.1 conserved hypothetical protein [Sebaldella termitidis ATCC 33386]SUI25280.1 Putative acetyltransferase SACOL2570 [Sebaldella termitidis]